MGIFDEQAKLFAEYEARLQFRNFTIGGTPLNPKLIESWLRAKAGITDQEEVRQAMLRTMYELGAPVSDTMSFEEVMAASEKLASVKQTTGFKRDEVGLYLEDRQVKAGLREWTNILFAGSRVGDTAKGAKNYLAERVFVDGFSHPIFSDRIHLIDPGTMEAFQQPTAVLTMIGHVNGPQGPRSTLGYHEYTVRAIVDFRIKVAQDCIPQDWWPQLFVLGQENGLGAARSQSYGKFDVLKFDRITESGHKKVALVKTPRTVAAIKAMEEERANGSAPGVEVEDLVTA